MLAIKFVMPMGATRDLYRSSIPYLSIDEGDPVAVRWDTMWRDLLPGEHLLRVHVEFASGPFVGQRSGVAERAVGIVGSELVSIEYRAPRAPTFHGMIVDAA
jgi:hypothetical protein